MSHSFVGTTLALQHYYDVIAISRKLPLMTIYQSHEQPFGQRMAIWMTTYGDEIPVSDVTRKRLDEALLKNRAVNDPHALRVLDFGTSEGFSFVVTDAIDDMITLRAWLRSHGTLTIWQTLRLLEQLVGIIQCAHQTGFKNLCLTCDNIFIKDPERFEIVTGPLGIGLHRSEILSIQNIQVTAELMKHIPPWEYAKSVNITSVPQPHAANPESQDLTTEQPQTDADLSADAVPITADDKGTSENISANDDNTLHHDSVQDLDMQSAHIEPDVHIITSPDDVCADTYNLASILYEALCGQHPYFNEDRDLCDAAFSIIQATPLDISKRVEISDDINDVVMTLLRDPKPDILGDFLNQFASCCPTDDREKARQADKGWLKPSKLEISSRKKRRNKVKIKHPLAMTILALVVVLGLTATVTWHIARYQSPIDLFALPEIVPAVPDGIDVVLAPHSIPPETSVYLTSHADGTLIKIGTLPFIYRQQAPDTHLNFVIADEYGHSMQIPVTVKGNNGLMLVPVDLNW